MAVDTAVLSAPLPESLRRLNDELQEKTHLLASSGDPQLAQVALDATKDIFDLGLTLESHSHSHLHPFLVQILQPPSIALRSKSKQAKEASPSPSSSSSASVDATSVLPHTPLSSLTVSGMDPPQIWAQLELRAEPIVEVVKEVGPGEQPEMDQKDRREEDEDSDEDEDEEDGSDEDMSVEEFKRMMMEEGIDEDMDSDEEDDDGVIFNDASDSEDEDEGGGENDLDFDSLDGLNDDEEDDEKGDSEDEEEESVGADGDVDDDEEDVTDDEEDVTDDEEDVTDDEEDDDEADVNLGASEDEEDDQAALFSNDSPGPSRKSRHPTLDDEFFSIDDFNRLTEEAEAGRLSSGRLGGQEDEDEDDLGDAGTMMLQGAGEEDESIMYRDFFEAPRGVRGKVGETNAGKGKGNGKGKGVDRKKKGKGKSVKFVKDDLMEDEVEEDDEEGEDGGRDVMGRVKGDLFDESDEEEDENNLSTHEKQQRALAKQIAELEQEAIGPKDWTLLGEATSRARPENSLLEEDLDFEQVAKVVPVVTEDTVKSLEELIKKRIIDNNFDSPVRVRAYEPTPYLPSRYFDLQDTQSSKSLAQIYEEEYQTAAAGGKVVDPRDEKLKKEHEEVDRIWAEICYQLDALSSLNFVPKQPKAHITTIDNLPTTTMESALPPTSAPTTLLAPEELFAPPTSSNLVARSELNPEQAQAARNRRRRGKKGERKKLGDMAELYGKKKGGGVKGEKERALQGLVKTGKGVTVVGKGEKETSKVKKRSIGVDGSGERSDGKRLKL